MKRVAIFFTLALLLPAAATAAERGLLWRVVQTCVASHQLIGAAFPCLAVNTQDGTERGYAVVRAPFEAAHIVVTPTMPTIGIEAAHLRGDAAPNYFADAWASRHYVTDGLVRPPGRGDLALAVNSRLGRSQDQLHIHVDCIRQDVKRALAASKAIHSGAWTRVAVLPRAPRYEATALDEQDFARTNIFALVQAGLHVDPSAMDEVTVVVVGAELAGRPGFIVLARRRLPNSRDEAHGEALMDHACAGLLR